MNHHKRGNKILWAWEIAKNKMVSSSENNNDEEESSTLASNKITQTQILEWMRNEPKKKQIIVPVPPPPPQPKIVDETPKAKHASNDVLAIP